MAQIVKNLPQCGTAGLIPGSERSPREGNGKSPVFLSGEFHGQRSLVGTVHGVTKNWA